ncbi:MAG: alkaline phosphatase family protein [Thermoanaerobaculum sp.]|nr:alkaline phosphatase family protein [Thermoanaerobaculum sp.]MDW7967485.1 alkaline phosphatase family protein [Thermoanaerobaculum sp.]
MRRGYYIAVCLVALVVALVTVSLIPPAKNRRVVTVSRFGEGVRLLPRRWNFAPWPFYQRWTVPAENGAALLAASMSLPLPSASAPKAVLRLLLEGAGPLPVKASQVRSQGLEVALGQAALVQLPEGVRAKLWQSTQQWRQWFPPAEGAIGPNAEGVWRNWLASLQPREVTLRVEDVQALQAEARALLRRLSPPGRLVVLGLDGLDWELVDQLTSRGVMPHLARLLRQGVQANLEVPPPLISPVIWTTIATGVSPEEHGVLDFLEPDPAGGPPHPISANARKVPALWEILAAAGRSTATIGWWATFPAQAPPGGVVYSDRLTEQLLGLSALTPALADPPRAQEEAMSLVVRAQDLGPEQLAELATVSPAELRQGQGEQWDDPVIGLAKLMAATISVERLTEKELQQGRDAIFAYLEGTDTVGHLFAPYRAPALPGTDPLLVARFGQVVDRYMARVDAWIGRVYRQLGPNDSLVILSDHGFTWGADRPRVPSGAHTATAVWWHRPVGVFIAISPQVAPSPGRGRMSVYQVAPTLLALAGLPRGAEMPGALPPWVKANSSLTVNYGALVGRPTPKRVELPPEARAEELAKLRALGYLSGETQPTAPAAQQQSPPPTPRFDRAEARRLNNLASSLAAKGDRKQAEAVFRQAIAADPSYPAPHYNLATFLRKEGRFDEADREFWLAIDTGIADPEATVVRSALDYRERGELARAEAMLRGGLERFPQSAVLLLNAGVFFGEQGHMNQAKELLRKAVALDPNNPKAHRNLAVALEALGDIQGALEHLATTVRLDPSDLAAQRELARLRQKVGVQ